MNFGGKIWFYLAISRVLLKHKQLLQKYFFCLQFPQQVRYSITALSVLSDSRIFELEFGGFSTCFWMPDLRRVMVDNSGPIPLLINNKLFVFFRGGLIGLFNQLSKLALREFEIKGTLNHMVANWGVFKQLIFALCIDEVLEK